MNCKESKKLEAYLAGKLNAQDAQRLEDHFSNCEHCKADLKVLQKEEVLLSFMDAVESEEAWEPYFWDPEDDFSPEARLTRAFHLSIDYDSMSRGAQNNFIREHEVDTFLKSLSEDDLMGYDEPFDTKAFAIQTSAVLKDAVRYQPYLDWRPLETVRRTLENTTQLAAQFMATPMKRHVKSLAEFLNKPRLHETVATDTMFSSVKDINGATCAQVYWGLTSHMINTYPMKKESDMPKAQDDFMRTEGIMDVLRSDNARVQRYGNEILRRLRRLLIGVEYTEPYNPQQNPAELRAIRWLKAAVKVLRSRTGAPAFVWYIKLWNT